MNRSSVIWRLSLSLCLWMMPHGLTAQTVSTLLIDDVTPDLVVPPVEQGDPSAGRRVRQTLPGWNEQTIYHTLYLPTNYDPDQSYPVIMEYAGNGNYENALGDVSTGKVDGSKLGYGVTEGRDAIWVCVPFLNASGDDVATTWWGDPPKYDVRATIEYCKQCVQMVCKTYGGDPRRVLLAGFSRGAIACNFVGLHDDEIASLWCGFIVYSHYDGVRTWPYSATDDETATMRLRRLKERPQFICHEQTVAGRGLEATRQWIDSTGITGNFTFVETGFRNHNDAWVLRPSPARDALRQWSEMLCNLDTAIK